LKAKKTDTNEVIGVDTVERGVHLTLVFQGHENTMADKNSPIALDIYDEFWINNHIDMHAINSIY
jgi:hypothetical protein